MTNPLKSLLICTISTLFLSMTWVAQAEDPAPGGDASNDGAPMADTGSDPRILPDLEQERLSALANSQLPDTETLWLETAHESFLGLYKPANRPVALGAVLLLHHDRTSADWPGAITTLRRGLPDQGWHTLSLALPDEPEYIPPRIDDVVLNAVPDSDDNGEQTQASQENGTESDPTDANKDQLADHYEQISARIEAGLNQLLQQQPEVILIVGQGSGAYWALRYSVDQQQQQPLIPVMLEAMEPVTPTEPNLSELVEKLQRPTLDLYYSGLDQQASLMAAKQRRDSAKRHAVANYRSIRLPAKPGDWSQLDRRLLGLMRGQLPKLVVLANQAKATQQADESMEQTTKQRMPGS
ncbi:DUF3530 family protein [Motiliproteus coralliicola]|uniref:DUF3530 family protein n=1 Tax=Motiliproteus coralliicola TaxID=2283196 RepID=A0A369WDM7_9GAMM|nr:DUF3530 family protein [Motiliproteus coralliicola]RDE19862.1 DUF3530 family protein [Motiliproteus coralliicola]